MWRIFRRDAALYLLVAPPLMLLLWAYFVMTRDALDTVNVLFQSAWIFYFVLTPLNIAESREDRNNGYALLAQLPLTSREIVTGKFLALLVAAAAVTAVQDVFISVFPGEASLREMGHRLVLAGGIGATAIGGLFYAAIFRFGYGRIIKFIWAGFVLVMLTPVLFFEIFVARFDVTPAVVSNALGVVPRPAAIALWVAVWWLLLRWTIALAERSGERM